MAPRLLKIALFLLIILVALVLATVGLKVALMVGIAPGLGLLWVLQMVQRDLGPADIPHTRAKEKRLRRARRRSAKPNPKPK